MLPMGAVKRWYTDTPSSTWQQIGIFRVAFGVRLLGLAQVWRSANEPALHRRSSSTDLTLGS